ncbi:hypothetical protein SAMN05421833_11855 [Microbispora rosea]|uniref:Uncharacterized protein n=1 Tax=Microbispora rosea TaxID=58117 RepID=A0A1N7EJ52_9ACTN|nr:hypothetical protein [Microbispora rosea]GIH49973.1 hypothetical protein Mro03_51520 [Microbispora rosea subsp. rosea]SIR88132.1 hypothetical protein SAMN05421833_11855 [Microbispora rosea]
MIRNKLASFLAVTGASSSLLLASAMPASAASYSLTPYLLAYNNGYLHAYATYKAGTTVKKVCVNLMLQTIFADQPGPSACTGTLPSNSSGGISSPSMRCNAYQTFTHVIAYDANNKVITWKNGPVASGC